MYFLSISSAVIIIVGYIHGIWAIKVNTWKKYGRKTSTQIYDVNGNS